MKRASSPVVAFVFAFLALAAGAAAQDKPNFSGNWKLAGTGPEFTPSQMVIAQDAKTLTITATSQMGEFKTPYNLDGTELKAPLDFNGTTVDRVTKAAWNGSNLVLTATSSFQGQSFEMKMVFSLDKDGTLQIESTRPDFQGGGAPVTSKLTYKKG